MLIGRTKHILYIKIQASSVSDNNRISFFKKEEEKRKHVFLTYVCMFKQLKSLYIVIKLIVHYNY